MTGENSYFYLSQKAIASRIAVGKKNALFPRDVTDTVGTSCWTC